MKIADFYKNFWVFGLTIGFITALILTLIITIWEWLENPSNIFHNANGTNWSFVYDTGISWFVPTFVQVTILSAAFYLLLRWIKRHRNTK